MVDKQPRTARRGRPRLHALGTEGHVRVELRVSPEIARLLYGTADNTGRTVSDVGEAALAAALNGRQVM